MAYDVILLHLFDRQAKPLIKKYPSLKSEIASLISSLRNESKQGSYIGSNCFKIRLAIASKGKGKSGGARIITHIHLTEDNVIYLISIYDKSEHDTISDSAVKEILKTIYL
jgi:hypothetical protein